MEIVDCVLLSLSVLLLWSCHGNCVEEGAATTTTNITTTRVEDEPIVNNNNNNTVTFVNQTDTTPSTSIRIITIPSSPSNISGMALRAFYVIIAVSSIVIVYFVVRSVCSRKRRQNTRRYGILRADKQDQMEMHPLSEVDDDDDDDEDTLFDISAQRKGKR